MKAYICNQCQKQGEVDGSYDLMPQGWYNVNDRSYSINRHFCSVACLRTFAMELGKRKPAEIPTAAEAVSER